jgi:hypothetical protein
LVRKAFPQIGFHLCFDTHNPWPDEGWLAKPAQLL